MSLSRFDEIAEFFDRVTDTALHRRLRASAARSLRPVSGRRILELGAGTGGLAVDLARDGAAVIALDGSPDMLRRARRRVARAKREHGTVRLIRGDASRLPFADAVVDGVAGVLVLHLLDDPVPALRECRRVARPGAGLAFVTQSDDFDANAAERVRGPLDPLEVDFIQGCAGSAASHPRLDRSGWAEVFLASGLPEPTITLAIPGMAWLVFAKRPG